MGNSSDLFHLSSKKKIKKNFCFSNKIFLYSLINYKCLTILFKFNEKNDMFYKIFSYKKKLNFYLRNKINLKRKVFRKKLNLYMFNKNKNKNFYLILLKFNLFKLIKFTNSFFFKF